MSSSRSSISESKEYQSFRASVPQKKVCYFFFHLNDKIVVEVREEEVEWKIYDFGSRDVRCPLICLPPVSGAGDIFFNQVMGLCCVGFRVIAVREH